ncbi:MAG: phosphate acyltransferase [bacterium]
MFATAIKPAASLARVVLCESFDQRILRAAHTLNQHRLARVILLGNPDLLDQAAVGNRTDLKGIELFDYESGPVQKEIKAAVAGLGAAEVTDPTDPVVAGAWLARTGQADMIIAGAATTATHTMRVFLKVLGLARECKTMSGFSLVAFENCPFMRHHLVGLADVSVVPEPTAAQLADIAIQSAASYERITGADAHVAFLSFSTAGSSDHPAARRIAAAVQLTRQQKPGLKVDGELQIDTALVPAVAGIKSPASSVAGNANVLVFPSLDAGNIAVKIFQKFSNYRVHGPILQGMACPAAYVPRGSSAEEIVDQVRLLAL